MTEQEIVRLLSTIKMKVKSTVADETWGKALQLIERLKSENAALKERLEKAVELPVKIGDRVFCIVGLEPAVEEFEVVAIKLQRSNLPYTLFEFQGIDVGYKTAGWLSEYGKKWFTELEAAEARLKELNGGKE